MINENMVLLTRNQVTEILGWAALAWDRGLCDSDPVSEILEEFEGAFPGVVAENNMGYVFEKQPSKEFRDEIVREANSLFVDLGSFLC